jgi:hypothetical protein
MLPESEIVGVTGLLLTCSYNNQEFFRVGYYVNNYYEEPELNENPPLKPEIGRLTRHILVEKPRVTQFQIQWEDEPMMAAFNNENDPNMANMMQQQQNVEGLLANGTQFKDRNDMMSSANIAQAAQNFFA